MNLVMKYSRSCWRTKVLRRGETSVGPWSQRSYKKMPRRYHPDSPFHPTELSSWGSRQFSKESKKGVSSKRGDVPQISSDSNSIAEICVDASAKI